MYRWDFVNTLVTEWYATGMAGVVGVLIILGLCFAGAALNYIALGRGRVSFVMAVSLFLAFMAAIAMTFVAGLALQYLAPFHGEQGAWRQIGYLLAVFVLSWAASFVGLLLLGQRVLKRIEGVVGDVQTTPVPAVSPTRQRLRKIATAGRIICVIGIAYTAYVLTPVLHTSASLAKTLKTSR